MEILLIAAMASNGIIGKDNQIPWNIPGEQKRFKTMTMGYPLIMGRKTWLSLKRPLPGRRNIVLTTQADFSAPGAEGVHSLTEALASCNEADKVFIIGGEQIFRQALPLAHTLILTVLDREIDGDASFPEFSRDEFIPCSSERIVHHTEPYTTTIYNRETLQSK